MMPSPSHFQTNEGSTQYAFFCESQGLALHNISVEADSQATFHKRKIENKHCDCFDNVWLRICYWK